MELDLIFKIAAIGVIVAILNQLLTKSDKGEYATLTTISGIIIVLLMIIPQIEDLFESIRRIVDF
ncbi:MAG: stage III sporulation protein AC [Clostridia bacterium]|nr:stage III sporulation protein AC [Clostridia bacterium]